MARHSMSAKDRLDPVGYDGLACPMTVWGTYDHPDWRRMKMDDVEYAYKAPAAAAASVFSGILIGTTMLGRFAYKVIRKRK